MFLVRGKRKQNILNPFNSRNLIVKSPLQLLPISSGISYENLVLDQDNNYLISSSILITCLLKNLWILQGEFNHLWELKN